MGNCGSEHPAAATCSEKKQKTVGKSESSVSENCTKQPIHSQKKKFIVVGSRDLASLTPIDEAHASQGEAVPRQLSPAITVQLSPSSEVLREGPGEGVSSLQTTPLKSPLKRKEGFNPFTPTRPRSCSVVSFEIAEEENTEKGGPLDETSIQAEQADGEGPTLVEPSISGDGAKGFAVLPSACSPLTFPSSL